MSMVKQFWVHYINIESAKLVRGSINNSLPQANSCIKLNTLSYSSPQSELDLDLEVALEGFVGSFPPFHQVLNPLAAFSTCCDAMFHAFWVCAPTWFPSFPTESRQTLFTAPCFTCAFDCQSPKLAYLLDMNNSHKRSSHIWEFKVIL